MPPKRGDRGGGFMGGLGATISTLISDPEPTRERGAGHAGGGGGSGGGRSATESTKDKGNAQAAAAASRNATELSAILGLAELVEVLNVMATTPPGVPPQLNQTLINRIKNSPLRASGAGAQRAEADRPPQPTSTPGPGPSSIQGETTSAPGRVSSSVQQPPATATALDVAELKGIQAGLGSISSTLGSIAQAVTEVTPRGDLVGYFQTLEINLQRADSETREAVKASTTIAKTQIEAVDKKVSQMSGKLDPLAEVAVGVKRLQAGLLDEAKAERTRLEARNKDLENQVKELQQVIHDTRAELLPVEVVSKIALQGVFSDEPDKKDGRGGNQTATGNLVQTAKKVKTNTLGLVAKCRVLFTFISRDPAKESSVPDLGMEGEWGRCVEYVQASNSKLRTAVEEKKETVQKLLFVGFVVEQIRKGHYSEKEWESDDNWKNFTGLLEKSPDGFASIRHLAQDLSRLTAQASTPPAHNGLTSSTAFEGSRNSTTKPTDATTQAPVEPSTPPAFTAPSSPVVPTSPITAKKDRDARPVPTKKRSSSLRIKRVFNPNPGPLYGWGPIAP